MADEVPTAEYQPYYAAFVRAHGRDAGTVAYITWCREQWDAFFAAHPGVRRYSDEAHRTFGPWLTARWP